MDKVGQNGSGIVFATKEMIMEKQAIPKRGHVGWRAGEGEIPLEVIFVDSLEGDAGWIPIIKYREIKAERRKVRRSLSDLKEKYYRSRYPYLTIVLQNSIALERGTGCE